MNFSLYIARRYLIAKKSQNVINIISGIAVAGVAIGTAALIIILSVMNGLEEVTGSLLNSFDPQYKIVPVKGKRFATDEDAFTKIKNHESVAHYVEVLEENVILRFNDRQYIATMKGVSPEYVYMSGIDTMMWDGSFILEADDHDFAVLGGLIASTLGFNLNRFNPIQVFSPKTGRRAVVNPASQFNRDMIFPSGIFRIQNEIDAKYIIVPLRYARKLLKDQKKVSAIELSLVEGCDGDDVQKELQTILGSNYRIKNRIQQQELVYKTFQSEKWSIFMILAFILVIASLNIISSLTMLILDKKDDIEILKSMGATVRTIKRIFLFEGWLISFIGTILGMILGLIFCYLQMNYQLVKLPSEGGFLVDGYPVAISFPDILIIMTIVLCIGWAVAWYPVRYISGKYLEKRES
ncbi:ABC transporter permease [Puteibacter caeruleilacunae]|nr:ABC transporter permease [Puteibacter caeruleilacunae]